MDSSKKCHRIGCQATPLRLFCENHLRNPSSEVIRFTKTVHATPINFNVKFCSNNAAAINNSMASALQMMHPLSLRKSTSVRSKLKTRIRRSQRHNLENLKVHLLSKIDKTNIGTRYAPNEKMCAEMKKLEPSTDVKMTDKFVELKQDELKHQLWLDADSKHVICFIPRFVEFYLLV